MPTRVGLVGAGFIAGRHLRNLTQFDDARVEGVADPAFQRAEALASMCGARPYRSYGEMLDREQLDALYTCIPPFAHGLPEAAAIERDLPFFVEKPLAMDFETARAIAAQVRAKSLVTAVGYHWRYLDHTDWAMTLLHGNPARLALGYWLDFTPPPPWWVKDSQSGGQIVEQTTHIFDLSRLLVGEVSKVYAAGSRKHRPRYPESDVHDVSAATLHFVSGAIGTMASTCVLDRPHRIGLHLFCEGMAIEMSEFDMAVHHGQERSFRAAESDPFLREDRDFIDAVRGGANRVRVPYEEALSTHRVVTAAVRSAREGIPVELPPQAAHA